MWRQFRDQKPLFSTFPGTRKTPVLAAPNNWAEGRFPVVSSIIAMIIIKHCSCLCDVPIRMKFIFFFARKVMSYRKQR